MKISFEHELVRAVTFVTAIALSAVPAVAQIRADTTRPDVKISRWDSVYAPFNIGIPSYDAETIVHREHIEVLLPPTYLRVQRPKPPVRGYYGWKFTFGRDALMTLVLRPDSALASGSDGDVVRKSSLFLCRDRQQWILSCTIPVRARARTGKGGIIVDVTDSAIVARVRLAKPSVLLRELFEPGGRFRVDETGIRYPAGG